MPFGLLKRAGLMVGGSRLSVELLVGWTLEALLFIFLIDLSTNKNLMVFELDGEGSLSYIQHQLQGKSYLRWGLEFSPWLI